MNYHMPSCYWEYIHYRLLHRIKTFTFSACYTFILIVCHFLPKDRRRRLEDLWLQRKIKLEQHLQLLLLDLEINKVSERYRQVGDEYLNNKELGDSLQAAQQLQHQHIQFEQQARVRESRSVIHLYIYNLNYFPVDFFLFMHHISYQSIFSN